MAHYVKFMRGTPEAYKNLAVKDNDTLYFISSEKSLDGALYLGSKLISGESEGSISFSLHDLEDVLISEGLNNRSLLIYEDGKWHDVAPNDLVFIGANAEANGLAGLVPAPTKGKTDLFLRSDGQWAEIFVDNAIVANQNIITIENTDTTNLHEDLIQGAIAAENIEIAKGDIIIIKDFIIDNKWQHTSYIYDGIHWTAMDGNYNADNVYFDDNFLVTTPIGTITKLENGKAILAAKGKNIQQVFTSLLAERKNPSVSAPYATITLTNSGSYEVGTKIIPTWETQFNEGSYSYGPETGVTDTGGLVTSTKDNNPIVIAEGKITNMTGSFEEYQVEDNTVYKASLTYGWNAGSTIPIDNFGDEYDVVKIESANNKMATSTNSITGYRAWFKGGLSTSSMEETLTPEIIRGFGASDSPITSKNIEIRAADYENCKRIVIAIPISANKGITQVYLKSTSNADITSEFIKQMNTIEISGAEGFSAKPYNIWVYEPALLDTTEIYTVTIG